MLCTFRLGRRHIFSSQNAEALLASTGESAVLEPFEPDGSVTFEDTCPQDVGAMTGEVQNQKKTSAMFLQL